MAKPSEPSSVSLCETQATPVLPGLAALESINNNAGQDD
jgi:hypothetical protein